MPPEPVIRAGACHAIFAFEAAQAVDLDRAERRLATAAARLRIRDPRRAPASFEYRPAPLRVTEDCPSLAVGAHRTAPGVDVVIYDFGALSVRYTVPLEGALEGLPELARALWGNAALEADARGHVERVLAALGDAATRPKLAAFVEDYAVFQIAALDGVADAGALLAAHGATVARTLRAEPGTLSEQEVVDALALRLSFGPGDATVIDTDAAFILDPAGDDVRDVLEFANTQLLEMRYLDAALDDILERTYERLSRDAERRVPGLAFRALGRLQLDAALLFERVTNSLKLIGEQYLTRVYAYAARRFHLGEWDASITRKLETLESVYGKLADRSATRRMEILEWIIIALIALELVLSLAPGFGGR